MNPSQRVADRYLKASRLVPDDPDPPASPTEPIHYAIKFLQQARTQQPRRRIMIVTESIGQLLDSISADMGQGSLSNVGVGVRNLRQLKSRIMDMIG